MSKRGDIAIVRRALDEFEAAVREDEAVPAMGPESRDPLKREEVTRRYRRARTRLITWIKAVIEAANA